MKFNKVAVGGTFDRMHKGHEELLRTAFSLGKEVVIGLTDDHMVKSKTLSEIIEPYADRHTRLTQFLYDNGFQNRSTIARLTNALGSALSDDSIEAVIIGPRVSRHVISQIKKIKPVISCKTIQAPDGSYLSSTRIRSGRVRRNGELYVLPDEDLFLPVAFRRTLQKPLGKRIIALSSLKKKKKPLVVSVGDATLAKLISHGVKPALVIVDGMIRKKRVFTEEQIKKMTGNEYRFVRTTNLAGTITADLVKTIQRSLDEQVSNRTKTVLYVRGEDDLAVLPAVYLAPLQSIVLYGQPAFPARSIKPGMISVIVTEKTKKEFGRYLSRFVTRDGSSPVLQ